MTTTPGGPDGATTAEPGTPTAANLLIAGEVNFARIIGPDAERLDAQGMNRLDMPGPGASLWLNQLDGRPTEDFRVRKALVHALDFEEVIKVNTGGTAGGAAIGLVVGKPMVCAGDTVSGRLPEFDVAAAEAMLDEAGWTMGTDGVRQKVGEELALDLHYWSGPAYNKPTAELIEDMWEAVGIRVTPNADSGTDMSSVMFETSDYDVYMQGFGWTMPYQMVGNFTGAAPPDGTNLAGVHNEEYEELVAKAEALTPPEACVHLLEPGRAGTLSQPRHCASREPAGTVLPPGCRSDDRRSQLPDPHQHQSTRATGSSLAPVTPAMWVGRTRPLLCTWPMTRPRRPALATSISCRSPTESILLPVRAKIPNIADSTPTSIRVPN